MSDKAVSNADGTVILRSKRSQYIDRQPIPPGLPTLEGRLKADHAVSNRMRAGILFFKTHWLPIPPINVPEVLSDPEIETRPIQTTNEQ